MRLQGHLDRRRERAFFGRTEELTWLVTTLSEAPRVVWLSGSGGVGKSALAERALAHMPERPVVRVEGGLLEHSQEALREACRCAPAAVLFIDEFERLEGLWSWWRSEALPDLAASVTVLVASRLPFPARWWLDPAWRELARHREVGPLDEPAASALLAALHVPETLRAGMQARAAGHPLTLWLLGTAAVDGDATRWVEAALDGLFAHSASDTQRVALQSLVFAGTLDEALLMEVLEAPPAAARRAFRWLSTHPFVTRTAAGLRLHSWVADAALQQEGSLATPAARALCRRLQEAVAERLSRTGRASATLVSRSFQRLLATEPNAWPAELPVDDTLYSRRARTDDDLALVLASLPMSVEERDVLSRWFARGPVRVYLIADRDDAAVGASVFCDLLEGDAPSFDPLAEAWVNALSRGAGSGSGRARGRLLRFHGSFASGRRPSAVLSALFDLNYAELFCDHALSFAGSVHHRDDGVLERSDRWLDLQLDGCGAAREWMVFGLDFRRTARQEALLRQIRLARGERPEPTALSPLDQRLAADLGRWLRRRGRWRSETLERLAIVQVGAGSPGWRADRQLRAVLDGLARERGGKVDANDARLLRSTFFGPPEKHVAIAAALGLSYGTFRRHVARAVSHLADDLFVEEERARARGSE